MPPSVILLVEDNPDDEALTCRSLLKEPLPLEIVVVRDGQQVLDWLFGAGEFRGRDVSELPALVLLDLKLPRVDGFEALERIRADPRTARVPVVVFTSSAEVRDIVRSYELGANSYVCKPVGFPEFSDTVRTLGRYWLLVNTPEPG